MTSKIQILATASLLITISCNSGGGSSSSSRTPPPDEPTQTRDYQYNSIEVSGDVTKVGNVELTTNDSLNGGANVMYDSINYLGETIVPIGSFTENSGVILGVNPITNPDYPLIGMYSDLPWTESNSKLGGVVYQGTYIEVYFTATGGFNNFDDGEVIITTSSDAGSISFESSSFILDGGVMVWNPELNAYSFESEVGYGEAYVAGEVEIVGGYALANESGGVVGTFAATSE